MITAAGGTGTGEPLLLLGITGENVTRMAAGEPIHLAPASLARLGLPPMHITLLYGRTEAAVLSQVRGSGVPVRPLLGDLADELRRQRDLHDRSARQLAATLHALRDQVIRSLSGGDHHIQQAGGITACSCGAPLGQASTAEAFTGHILDVRKQPS